MIRFNRILACVDLSEYSRKTMEYAVALSRAMMTDMIVLNVINIREIEAINRAANHYSGQGQICVDDYVEQTKADRLKRVYELINNYFSPDSNKITAIVEVGVPFKTILEIIERKKIDVVVQGNKGRTNAVGALFGSHAEKVFRHSPVPVFSVRS